MDTSDAEWLSDARSLTLWAVDVPAGLLASLPQLEWLDIRGGSESSIDYISECTKLSYLQVNQVRGLSDLTVLNSLKSLRLLSLHGLPKVRQLPSFAPLVRLRRLEVGSMKGLSALAPALEAPALTELVLVRDVTLAPADPDSIRDHPALQAFTWFAEDVPDKTWAPVMERVGLPQARILQPDEWFERNP
ncbi:hypothetical protein ACSVHC_15630 [Arthrobacter sp. KNU-44]|uniref:hypothetical protein n=1 Tax=Arthrobacter sp. KNU-44 TaxID=3450744 RepID=UPI003F437CBA